MTWRKCGTGFPVATPANLPTSRLDASATLTAPSNDKSFSSDGTLTPDTQDSDFIKMADALGVLSAGALLQVNQGESPESPVLQCVQIKPMAAQNGVERYRLVLNDSLNFIQCMLATREWGQIMWAEDSY